MFLVALGGFFGAMARYSITQLCNKLTNISNIMATFFVNSLGSFLLGVTFGIQVSEGWYSLLAIGFLGAFTTFSTFSFEVFQLIEQRKYPIAFSYLTSTILLGIGLALAGYYISYTA
ncbi:MAG: CrcB family protein [Solibacillus sp.]|jgi:fluoride exporter|uniref:fluoride efflux transporter FluC n=1 Tax=unclassified Solibacillus TaxID=2637870 RepID=UPI0030F74C00